jgi:hypothetical protein
MKITICYMLLRSMIVTKCRPKFLVWVIAVRIQPRESIKAAVSRFIACAVISLFVFRTGNVPIAKMTT